MRYARQVMLLLGTLCCVLAQPAWAEGCSLFSTPAINFGSYNVYSTAPLDSVSTVSWKCQRTRLLAYITLDEGQSGTYSQRTMTSGANTLQYNLYTDAARTTVWGDGTSGTSEYTFLFTSSSGSVNIYGRIPALQDVAVGHYSDSVTVTIVF
jgi:spore coat protein U-like protein